MNMLILTILVILAIVGICDILRMAVLFFIDAGQKKEYSYLVIPIYGFCEDIEDKIRASAAKLRWCDSCCAKRIICLDCGMDTETRRICEKTASDYSFISIVDIDNFESDSFPR